MLDELARQGEFAETMANHVFRDEYGYMLFAVVDTERMTDEIRVDDRSACPGLDDALLTGSVESLHFF